MLPIRLLAFSCALTFGPEELALRWYFLPSTDCLLLSRLMLDRGGKLWMLLRVSVCSAEVAWSDCCDSLSLPCSPCDNDWLPLPLPLRVSFAAAVRKEVNIDSCLLLLLYPYIVSVARHSNHFQLRSSDHG